MRIINLDSRVDYINLINQLEKKNIRFIADYENGSGVYQIIILGGTL